MTDKQFILANSYVIDFNITNAAAHVGITGRNARNIAWRMLNTPEVAKYVLELKEERMKDLQVTADRVLKEAARSAYSDISDYYDEDGNFKPIHTMDKDLTAAIESVEYETDKNGKRYISKLKLHGKDQPLEKLFKYLGMYKVDNAQLSNVTITTKEHKRTVKDFSSEYKQEEPGENV